MNVNYDPEGIVSFHEDGYPVHSRITIQFRELEYVISGDAVSSNYENVSTAILDNQSTSRIQARLNAEADSLTAAQKRNPHTR